MYSCFVHLLYLDRLSWANVIKWKGSLRSPSLFTPDLIVVVLSIYIRRELISSVFNGKAFFVDSTPTALEEFSTDACPIGGGGFFQGD